MELKFEVGEKPEPTLHATLDTENSGHLRLCINGETLLWVRTDGTIQRSCLSGVHFRKLGFSVDGHQFVKLYSEG